MSRHRNPDEGRLYWGAEISRPLIAWLNTTKGTRRNQHIVSLLAEIQNYFIAVGERPIPTDISEVRTLWWQGREVLGTRFDYLPRKDVVNRAFDAVKAAVLKYSFSPELVRDFGGRLLFDWSPSKRNWRKVADHVADGEDRVWFTETHAVARIVELCREGLILRLKKCRCGLWYYAKFTHMKFHSTACQQKAYRDDPEWRAHRREYMKRNRALHGEHAFRSPKEPIRPHMRKRGE